ncbi:hypothetical protein WBG78_04940 [Chryseolinea sp. T2]|uniref:hypothetical protein n=1 Tax=Chryseolinea sp. T2 TaxID=3129255 RepID=UPI003076B9C8
MKTSRRGESILLASLLMHCLVLISTLNSIAQTTPVFPSVNIVSPNASAIAKFGDYPVNMHTGVPEISIPIHTVKEGSLELPISISYHAAGLKVQEVASWVGAGFSLNAGGVVSRTVKGMPDEKAGFENDSFFSNNGYSTYFMDENNLTDYRDFQIGFQDGEPDLFFFTAGNHSGKFYIRGDKTAVMFPESDYKVEIQTKTGANTYNTVDYIQGFVITAPDGTRYYFGVKAGGSDPQAIEKVDTKRYEYNGMATYSNVISSWYLYKVESADRKYKIDLNYRAETYAYYDYIPQQCASCSSFVPFSVGTEYVNLLKTMVTGVAVNQITSSNEIITFVVPTTTTYREDLARNTAITAEEANNSAKALSEIKIQSTRSTYCTTYKLTQSYFTSTAAQPQKLDFFGTFQSDKKRLKLDAIQKFVCESTVSEPPYIFNYYEPTAVPRRLSFGQDHWGFYNGAETNDNLIPALSDGVTTGFALFGDDDRDSHWPQMRAGTLRSLRYPTGGGTEFIYEPNKVNTSQCRVQSISPTGTSTSAGMSTAAAEFGTVLPIDVAQPSIYYYTFQSQSTGSGSLYINNMLVASVEPGQTKSDYIFLPTGSHTVQCSAGPDNGSGQGVTVVMYTTTSNCVSVPKIVGGMRVKRIEQFGIERSPIPSKDFEYDRANLYSIPVYIMKMKHELVAVGGERLLAGARPDGCQNSGLPTAPLYVRNFVSPTTLQPLQTTQGYHIGYGWVKEKNPDGGYTIYEYSGASVLPSNWLSLEDVAVRKIDASKCLVSDPNYSSAPLPHDFTRGNLIGKTFYDNSGRKITQTLYEHQYVTMPVGIFGVSTLSHPDPGIGTALPTHYSMKTSKLTAKIETQRTFNPSNEAEYIESKTRTDYASTWHSQVTKTTVTDNLDVTEGRFTYVPDLTECNATCATCSQDYTNGVAALQIFYRDNTTAVCGFNGAGCTNFVGCDPNYNPCSNNSDCRICAWTDYQYRLNVLRMAYTTCIQTCKNTKDGCITTGIANTNADMKALHNMESANQIDIPVEVSQWKNNQLLESTYFKFVLTDASPVGVRVKEIYKRTPLTPATGLTAIDLTTGGIIKDAKYSTVPEVTYEYANGRIIEQTGRDGVKTSYIWGFSNTVPIVKAVGVSYTTLNTAYTADPINFRSNSTLVNAQITTYDYDPVVGIVSITDPNSRKQTYNYDLLGRLVRIKDHEGNVVEQYKYYYQGQ